MPRRDRDEYDRPRKPNTGVIVGMVIAGVVLFGFLAGMAALLVWGGSKAPVNVPGPVVVDQPKGSAAPAAKVYSKQEFEALVLNKTKEEVIAAVGRPDDTKAATRDPGVVSFITEHWFYHYRVQNEATGKPYLFARVFVDQLGRAVRLDYQ